ncbi:MAG: 4Fe-4S ferredoxin iron-sulfur binding domain protein [Firmicutes bacterium]|nr:4Fe-4S ferredoxin iron-sulfur binding domain protein [Bacillota bacterium]
MSSKVYFVNLRARSPRENKISKIKKLYDAAGFDDLTQKNDLTAIKLHFGERGNDSYINPVFVRQVVDKLKAKGAKPFLTDTNTLYSGSRHNAVDHLVTALEHGFDFSVTGAPLIIADGLRSENIKEVTINKKHFQTVKLAKDIVNANSMIVMSHFKGHEMAGFGGAIKNMAMGAAPAVGKKEQHSVNILVNQEKCVGCGKCDPVCPEQAIALNDKKSFVNPEKCIGCGECMTVCPIKAIGMDWGSEVTSFMERMTEYAYGVVKSLSGRIGYINFLTNITPDCDCVPWSDAPIVPDIGFLASIDPVALDQASYDLVNKQIGLTASLLSQGYAAGEEKFDGLHPGTKGGIQLEYGEEIGMGSRAYTLIEL